MKVVWAFVLDYDRWDDVLKRESCDKRDGIKKRPGCRCVEAN